MAWQSLVAGGVYELFNRTYGRGEMASESVPAPPHVSAMPRGVNEAKSNIRGLVDRLDELTLACRAMWELLEEKTSLTHEDLFAKIREIDLADGVEDGKVAMTVKKCPSCGRTMSERHKKCLYCGAVELKETPFEGI